MLTLILVALASIAGTYVVMRFISARRDPADPKDDASRWREKAAQCEHELNEALQQQTATSEILRVISSSPTDVQRVLDAISESVLKLCHAENSAIMRPDLDGHAFRLLAACGPIEHPTSDERLPITRSLISGRAFLDRRAVQVPDILAASAAEFTASKTYAARHGWRSFLAIPMLREGDAVGVLALAHTGVRAFSGREIELLMTFADQAVIAIENARLFSELQERLEQQTATSEILRVISQSQSDVQPVFETIATSARKLCAAKGGTVFTLDGELLRRRAVDDGGATLMLEASFRDAFPRPVSRDNSAGRAILTRSVCYIPDVHEDSEFGLQALAEGLGYRSTVSVPMIRDGTPIGVINVIGSEPAMFTERQIAMLQTFADQAVIAIENTRLFNELEKRNRDLSEALEQQTATSEILRVVSQSQSDVQPVFDVIVDNARKLCGGTFGAVYRYDGKLLHIVAVDGFTREGAEVIRRSYPSVPGRGRTSSRAILTGAVAYIPDVREDPEYQEQSLAEAVGFRSSLSVPMLRDGSAIGAVSVGGSKPAMFSARQIAMLETFADQAVIAIENTRLFNELQEQLEQQTATSEILRVISQSQRDVQPVFEVIAANARKLCAATFAGVHTFDGKHIDVAAADGLSAEALDKIHRTYPTLPSRDGATGRAILDRTVCHVPDVQEDAAYRHAIGHRSVLSVPMLRERQPIGAITVSASEPAMFTERQIAMLQVFADQAVIAIENTRLFTELQERLEQQTATSEILRVISSSPTDLQPVLNAVAESAARLCDASDAVIFRIDSERLKVAARHGSLPHLSGEEGLPISRDTASGRSVVDRVVVHIPDLLAEPENEFAFAKALGAGIGYRAVLVVPMLREETAIGAIGIRRTEAGPFSDKQIGLLRTFADQAVIAIENTRLFTELQERLEQQTATSDILRVISESQRDVQPVFEAIATNARRLCNATFANVFRFDGEFINVAASDSSDPKYLETLRQLFPMRPSSGSMLAARAILARAVVYVPDVREDPEYPLHVANAGGFLSALAIPMLRNGIPIGSITVASAEPGMFTERQTAMLQTFADQAVIAIENTRLFNELQTRTAELGRSVERLRSLAEVGEAVNSTLDLEQVLTTIVARAVQLSQADGGVVFEFDEATETFQTRATHGLPPEYVEILLSTPLRIGEGATGRAATERAPVHIPDVRVEGAYTGPLQQAAMRLGTRAVLAVPLLREGRVLGSLVVNRNRPGAFAPEVVDLLQTFAAQSTLAIQNARLFREIEQKSRELQIASQHKSQFLANMSHELRTPLNAILGYAELIVDRIYGEVPEKINEVLDRVQQSGRHLLGLINDVLDLSKIEAGQLVLTLSDYTFSDIVQAVVSSVGSLAAEKRLKLTVEVAPHLPVGHGDERRIAQVLLNLVGNAIKFTEKGEVGVRVSTLDGMFLVAVSDTGPGIKQEDQEKIFEEFQQSDTAVAKSKSGTGLGLAIAKRIVELHGGRIWVESALEKGSTFFVNLPVKAKGRELAA